MRLKSNMLLIAYLLSLVYNFYIIYEYEKEIKIIYKISFSKQKNIIKELKISEKNLENCRTQLKTLKKD